MIRRGISMADMAGRWARGGLEWRP